MLFIFLFNSQASTTLSGCQSRSLEGEGIYKLKEIRQIRADPLQPMLWVLDPEIKVEAAESELTALLTATFMASMHHRAAIPGLCWRSLYIPYLLPCGLWGCETKFLTPGNCLSPSKARLQKESLKGSPAEPSLELQHLCAVLFHYVKGVLSIEESAGSPRGEFLPHS